MMEWYKLKIYKCIAINYPIQYILQIWTIIHIIHYRMIGMNYIFPPIQKLKIAN